MKVSLSLNNDKKKSAITIDGANQEIVKHLINLAANFAGGFVSIKRNDSEKPIKKLTDDFPLKDNANEIGLLPEVIRDWYKEQKDLAKANNEPSFFRTGIKFKDGSPKFKARYTCPNCGNVGKQYEELNAKETTCHNCKSIIDIEQTKKFPFPDEHLNFFVSIE